jgi:hypothetical protein
MEVVRAVAHSPSGSAVMATRGPAMAARSYEPGDMHNFLNLFDLLREAGITDGAPLLETAEPLYRRAAVAGLAQHDIAAVIEVLAEIPPPPKSPETKPAKKTRPAPHATPKAQEEAEARRRREAEALRENLKKRRGQAEARGRKRS